MELRQYFYIFRRWLWLFILAGTFGGVTGFVGGYFQAPVYQTSAKIFISQPSGEQLSEFGYLGGQQLIQTYAQLLRTDPIIEATNVRLEYPVSKGRIRVQQIGDTQILNLTVEDNHPQWAAAIANTLVEVFKEQQYAILSSRYAASKESLAANLEEQQKLVDGTMAIIEALEASGRGESAERNRLEDNLIQYRSTYASLLQSFEQVRIAETQSVPNVELVEPAKAPGSPVRPRPYQNGVLGAVAGLVLAGGLVFLVEYLDDTIRSPEEVTRVLQTPIIGYIAQIRGSGKTRRNQIVVAGQPRSPISEAFRTMRTNLEFAGVAKPLKTILVTSPGPGEGKTTVAANLALVMTQSDKRVALIDADLRRPRIHRMLGIENRRGLSDYFRNGAGFDDISQMFSVAQNLIAIPSGKLPPNPAELLGSEKMMQLLEKLKEDTDAVIIDSPPVIVTDAIALSAKVDGVVVVIQPGTTKMGAAKNAMEQFSLAGARVVGIVLNRITKRHSSYYRGYYPGYYSKGYYTESKKNGLFKRRKTNKRPRSQKNRVPSRTRQH